MHLPQYFLDFLKQTPINYLLFQGYIPLSFGSESNFSSETFLEAFYDEQTSDEVYKNIESFLAEKPDLELVPIGGDGSGGIFCIALSDKHNGQIWYWADEFDFVYICPSFQDFLTILRSPPKPITN